VNNDFRSEVGDIEPIQTEKVSLQKPFRVTPGQIVRQEQAQSESSKRNYLLSSGDIKLLTSQDILDFKRSGVQHGVYKKLRMGKYQIDARLDLHKESVEEARIDVFQFIQEAYHYKLRTLLILHGKGDRNPDKVALLKSYVAIWLPELEPVLAFHSAQSFHGGTGAVYVLLKKGIKC